MESNVIEQIKKDYIEKIKGLFDIVPEERIGRHCMSGRPYLYTDYKLRMYVDRVSFTTMENMVYGIVKSKEGNLFAVFSNYDRDYLMKIERLGASDIVLIYNRLEKNYLKNEVH